MSLIHTVLGLFSSLLNKSFSNTTKVALRSKYGRASAANRLLIKIYTQNNKSENAQVPLRSTRSSVHDDTAGWSQLGSAVGRPEQLWRLLTEFCLCQGALSSQAVRNGLFVIRPLCLKQEIKLMWTALSAEQRCRLRVQQEPGAGAVSCSLCLVQGSKSCVPPSATGIVYDEVKLKWLCNRMKTRKNKEKVSYSWQTFSNFICVGKLQMTKSK